jgi:hypothetical protein
MTGIAIVICGLPRGENHEYKCMVCGFESDERDDYAVNMCWECIMPSEPDDYDGDDFPTDYETDMEDLEYYRELGQDDDRTWMHD